MRNQRRILGRVSRGIGGAWCVGVAIAGLAGCTGERASRSGDRGDSGAARDSGTQERTQAAPVWAMAGADRSLAGAPTCVGDSQALLSALSMPAMWGRVNARADLDMVAGTLVSMNGRNVLDGDEMRLGVVPTSRANDPSALGVVVAPGVSAFDRSLEGARAARGVGREGDIVIGVFAHEVVTAGAARVWVVEESPARAGVLRDLSPGDLLISADAAGCAMLDDASRFEVGYVIGRVAEHASWSRSNAGDTGPDGRRRMLVTVVLERFVRPSMDGLSRGDVLELQRREMGRWQEDWERDVRNRYRWDDMSRTWDEMDRFRKRWGDDWNDDKTWRDLRDSSKRMREQDDQLRRLRDELDKSRRELEETRRNLDDLSREVKGGRNDTGSRGGPDGGVRPAPR